MVTLEDIRPVLATKNMPNHRPMYSDLAGNLLPSQSVLMVQNVDIPDILLGELAPRYSAVASGVLSVLCRCTPIQIVNVVVSGVVVLVATFRTWWTRANPSFEDKEMDVTALLLAISTEEDAQILLMTHFVPERAYPSVAESSVLEIAPYAAVTSDGIVRPAWNGFQFIVHAM
jgi:hypothetical protein